MSQWQLSLSEKGSRGVKFLSLIFISVGFNNELCGTTDKPIVDYVMGKMFFHLLSNLLLICLQVEFLYTYKCEMKIELLV